MDNKIKNYIFDLDGTVINSCEEVLRCFELAFAKSNYPIDKNRLTSDLIGPPLKEIIQNIAPELKDEKVLNEITANFRTIYDNDINDISFLYEGVCETLQNLKNQGKKIFLATLKPSKPTERIVRDFGLKDIFDDIYTIDKFGEFITKKEMIEHIITKYSLNKSETVMIGDASSDVISANEAEITSIGVLWGYGSDKTDLIKNSKFVIKNIKELECLNI